MRLAVQGISVRLRDRLFSSCPRRDVPPTYFALYIRRIRILLLLACCAGLTAHAQWQTSGNNISNTNSGNVGIGTGASAPWSALDIRTNGSTGSGYYGINVQNPSILAWSTININMGSGPFSHSVISSQQNNLGKGAYLFFQTTDTSGTLQTRMTITDAGYVGVGTSDTKGYQFAVNGSAIFTAAWIKAYINWPDYIFKKDYRLPSLDSLSNYIQANSHLPDIPSAETVSKSGINLGDTQAALLKKIEELTLYIIEQNNVQKGQEQQIRTLQEKLEHLETLVGKNKSKVTI